MHNFRPTPKNKESSIKRIDPRGAQQNDDILNDLKEQSDKLKEVIAQKDLNETQNITKIPRLNIDQLPRMLTEEECPTVSSKYNSLKKVDAD